MVQITLSLPNAVAAEFYTAANLLNDQFGPMKPALNANALMAFALARFESRDVCAQFDVTMRAITGQEVPVLPNPVLK